MVRFAFLIKEAEAGAEAETDAEAVDMTTPPTYDTYLEGNSM